MRVVPYRHIAGCSKLAKAQEYFRSSWLLSPSDDILRRVAAVLVFSYLVERLSSAETNPILLRILSPPPMHH